MRDYIKKNPSKNADEKVCGRWKKRSDADK